MRSRIGLVALISIAVAVLAIEESRFAFGQQGDPTQSVVDLTNGARQRAGAAGLQVDPSLTRVAEAHALWMAESRCFDHQCPGEVSVQQRAEAAGYRGGAGENISVGLQSPEEAVSGWMNSAAHRQNILAAQYTDIGVGVACGPGNRPYWVQVFGGRTSTPLASATAAPTARPSPAPSPAAGPNRSSAATANRLTPQRESWLVAFGNVQVYSLTDQPLWRTSPGEWYRVSHVQAGWALAARESDSTSSLVWIPTGSDVEFTWIWRVCP